MVLLCCILAFIFASHLLGLSQIVAMWKYWSKWLLQNIPIHYKAISDTNDTFSEMHSIIKLSLCCGTSICITKINDTLPGKDKSLLYYCKDHRQEYFHSLETFQIVKVRCSFAIFCFCFCKSSFGLIVNCCYVKIWSK